MGIVDVTGVGEELWSEVGAVVSRVRTLIGACVELGVVAGAQGNPFAKNSLASRP